MNEEDRRLIVERYRRRLEEQGDDFWALASGSREHQMRRFRMLEDVGITSGCSVLDLGCGTGEFRGYLEGRGIQVEYTGYDISADLIELAASRYPDATFEVRDIQTDGCPRTFDLAVASQVFNNRLAHEDNMDVVTAVMRQLLGVVDHGFAIDFLSTFVDYREERHYYYDPAQLLEMAKGLSPWVTVRHDYLPYEFAIYVLKAPSYGEA